MHMEVKISGIVIDQTRTEGKWYVRELKDKNGDVTPMFFRREKSDLIGRLVDKFRRVESAQRFAASHMKELGFHLDHPIGYLIVDKGKIIPEPNEREKLQNSRLELLLKDKVTQASATTMTHSKNEESVQSASHVTVILRKSDLNQELSLLWDDFKHLWGAQNKNDKKAFFKAMGDAIRLSRRDMVTSDPKVWERCRGLVKQFSTLEESLRLQGSSKTTWETIRSFFAPT